MQRPRLAALIQLKQVKAVPSSGYHELPGPSSSPPVNCSHAPSMSPATAGVPLTAGLALKSLIAHLAGLRRPFSTVGDVTFNSNAKASCRSQHLLDKGP